MPSFAVAGSVVFAVSAAATLAVRAAARRRGWLVLPRPDRWHTEPTALFGGLAVLAGLVVGLLWFTPMAWPLPGLLALSVGMCGVGLADDVADLRPQTKLIAQLSAGLLLYLLDFHFNAALPWLLDLSIVVVWDVAITNAMNLLDNMNGLCAGTAVIAAGFRCLFYLEDGPNFVVVASNAGDNADPQWWKNLQATPDASVETLTGYDATRSLGHVRLDGAPAEPLTLSPSAAATAWYLAQGLIAAEAVGAIERALETSVAYAKERFTFGRAIGSYQAVKHELVEILRRLENARSLMYYAGWAAADKPEELAVAASAFRLVASEAYDHAARAQISVHGGIGATWEHDAPLFYRRAQLDKRLLGGTGNAADRVADELFAQAREAAAA